MDEMSAGKHNMSGRIDDSKAEKASELENLAHTSILVAMVGPSILYSIVKYGASHTGRGR